MSRIFITGSTDGLGLAAARTLMNRGHDVVLHARSRERAAAISDTSTAALGLVIGDLASAAETRSTPNRLTPSAAWTPSSTMPASTSNAAAAKRLKATPRRWRSTCSPPISSPPGSPAPTA